MTDVFQEHLSYFQLPRRLDLYSEAVKASIKPGDTVADLGCGFGVLGVLCLKHGASKVWGIDNSDAIHVAREMVDRAGLAESYHCIAGSTFTTELPEKVDVIICDHVGFFGFDYGMIGMLRDAKKRFLKPGGVIMPQALQLMVAGVSTKAYDDISGPWERESTPSEYRWLREASINTKHAREFAPEEMLSDAARLGAIDLLADGPDFFSFSATLTMARDGVFHGLAGWFDCLLGGDIWMTNSPVEDRSIKRPQAFLAVEQPFAVTAGDVVEVTIKIRPDDNMIAWTVDAASASPRQKMSSWKSAILSPDDLTGKSVK